jgi:copper homeostasis protein
MLEVCVECLEGVRTAVQAGAERIEFSERLDVGGVTPAIELLRNAVRICRELESEGSSVAVPVIALIRCRPGDFFFDGLEQHRMLEEIERAIDIGCDGVAVGASFPGHDLNWAFIESVARAHATRSGFELVVHRVFDTVPDPMRAIPRLIDLGYRRILTSGGTEHAIDSLEQLRRWQEAFGDRMEFLPAGGISASNAATILKSTGCKQLHGSLRGVSRIHGKRLPDPDEIRKVKQALVAVSSVEL